MTISQIIEALERVAPLSLQDGFDNAGVQISTSHYSNEQTTGILVCLDITEDIIKEAIDKECNLVVSHHPLIFEPLKRICAQTYQQRCVAMAIKNGITLYSAHTNLDNAPGGVNYRIAELIGVKELQFMEPREGGGSGVIGTLSKPLEAMEFLQILKSTFKVEALQHNFTPTRAIEKKTIGRVAICGGAGSFLLEKAQALGADAFITGEMSYHHWFGKNILVAAMGHFRSEQFTMNLIADIIKGAFPQARVVITTLNTNPVSTL